MLPLARNHGNPEDMLSDIHLLTFIRKDELHSSTDVIHTNIKRNGYDLMTTVNPDAMNEVRKQATMLLAGTA